MATAKTVDDKLMTREGYDKLKAELIALRGDGRAEIAAKLEEARGFGDLSENAEYHAAKEEQEKLENRVLWLEYQLSKAQVVETEDIDTNHVNLGTTVTIKDLDLKKILHIHLLEQRKPTLKKTEYRQQALLAWL